MGDVLSWGSWKDIWLCVLFDFWKALLQFEKYPKKDKRPSRDLKDSQKFWDAYKAPKMLSSLTAVLVFNFTFQYEDFIFDESMLVSPLIIMLVVRYLCLYFVIKNARTGAEFMWYNFGEGALEYEKL